MKRAILYLLIGIPAASVVMGMITLYVAFNNSDPEISVQQSPLNKTSWQEPDHRSGQIDDD